MKCRVGTCVLLAVLCLVPGVHAATRMLQPAGGEKTWLSVGGKSRLYYRLNAGAKTTLEVKGPGEIKFIVRPVTETAGTTPVTYSVVVSEKDHPLKTVQVETVPGSATWTKRRDFAGPSRSFKMRLSEGSHVLQVSFQSSTATAAGFRYSFTEGPGAGVQVPIHATGTRESVTLLVKERPLDYYVGDAKSPVQVEVIGPTRLRVVSRLIFPSGGRGTQNYVLKVERDKQPLSDVTLTTTKSAVVECEAHRDWIMGKAQTSYVDIPKGAHVVTFRLSNSDAPGVALRFSIPKEAVNAR